MMREDFGMNRPTTSDQLERFLKSLPYPEICQELTHVDGNSCVMNDRSPDLCYNTQIQNSHLNRVEPNAVGTKKEIPTSNDKRKRTLFTPFQLTRMEEEFRQNMYVVGLKRWQLATELSLTEKQVKIWFQNRRMKLKREHVKTKCINSGFPWY